MDGPKPSKRSNFRHSGSNWRKNYRTCQSKKRSGRCEVVDKWEWEPMESYVKFLVYADLIYMAHKTCIGPPQGTVLEIARRRLNICPVRCSKH